MKRRTKPMAPAAPSSSDMLRWSAENMARNAVENHPKVKRMRDHITREVMKATRRAMGAKRGKDMSSGAM